MNTRHYILPLLLLLVSAGHTSAQKKSVTRKPNIIFIYVDDLGYGDVGCYGATRVKTPNVDQLAKGGIKFTDGHCTASTCTPSRFALLTGSYAFRNDAAILPGDAPLIINPKQQTMPGMLKKAGYTTGVVGKWHLGLGTGSPDWNGSISPGPLEIGFDYSFILPATADRVPTVYVENHNVVNLDKNDPIQVRYDKPIGALPTGLSNPELLKLRADTQHSNTIVNGISRIGYMTGGTKAYWRDEDFADVFTTKALSFIDQNKSKPFFLYFALPNIHVPRTPHERFVGKSSMGTRGDVIAEMDWMTGEVMKQLRKLKIEGNTILIFSSDNGPVVDDGYYDNAERFVGTHKPAGPYNGGKYSAFEGGTRVPFIMSWPGTIKPAVSKAMVNQVDFFRSFAVLTGVKIEASAAPDSKNMLAVFLGNSKQGRTEMVEEAFTMSYRQGNWKYIAPVTKATPAWLANKTIPTGLQKTPQLYNLSTDPAERENLAAQMPAKVNALANLLKQAMAKPTAKELIQRSGIYPDRF